jgi:hypothetical protein
VIPDRKGVNYRIGGLYLFSQKFIKAVLINALFTYGAAEAAKTTAREGIFADIYHSRLIRERGAEAAYHIGKV